MRWRDLSDLESVESVVILVSTQKGWGFYGFKAFYMYIIWILITNQSNLFGSYKASLSYLFLSIAYMYMCTSVYDVVLMWHNLQ